MLINLHVKNLALIDEADIYFDEGLNILTGETGAGKSILLGSINLALGAKASRDMLGKHGDFASVELLFQVDESTVAALAAKDIFVTDNQVLISRKFTENRNIMKINGENVTLATVRDITSLLIDIHGQHEHQSLLSKKKHLDILDEYAKKPLGNKKQTMAALYKEYKSIKEEFENAGMDAEQRNRELSFLTYEVDEIDRAGLVIGEDEELEEQFKRFSNGKKIMESVNAAYQMTGMNDASASELIGSAARELTQVMSYDKDVEKLQSQIAEIDSLLSDFNHEISGYISNAEFDDETFYKTQKRLDEINHLKSKYGSSIEEILAAMDEKQKRIEVLNDYDAYLKTLNEKLNAKKQELSDISEEVSKIRKREAKKLTKAIKEALVDLNFLDVAFEMEFEKLPDFTANGIDIPEFVISTNPGEALKPLGKIASGGELSRIMLGIKAVMAENDHIESLIFDEIDSGISGRTAQMVSEKMNELGRNHQIICITHLPHFLIEKSVENKSTVSRIYKLSEEQSISELARMLGGVEITDTVMQSAKEMKNAIIQCIAFVEEDITQKIKDQIVKG